MQLSKVLCSPSLAYDSAHVKYTASEPDVSVFQLQFYEQLVLNRARNFW